MAICERNTLGLNTTQPRATNDTPELSLMIRKDWGRDIPCPHLRDNSKEYWDEGFVIVASKVNYISCQLNDLRI